MTAGLVVGKTEENGIRRDERRNKEMYKNIYIHKTKRVQKAFPE